MKYGNALSMKGGPSIPGLDEGFAVSCKTEAGPLRLSAQRSKLL